MSMLIYIATRIISPSEILDFQIFKCYSVMEKFLVIPMISRVGKLWSTGKSAGSSNGGFKGRENNICSFNQKISGQMKVLYLRRQHEWTKKL